MQAISTPNTVRHMNTSCQKDKCCVICIGDLVLLEAAASGAGTLCWSMPTGVSNLWHSLNNETELVKYPLKRQNWRFLAFTNCTPVEQKKHSVCRLTGNWGSTESTGSIRSETGADVILENKWIGKNRTMVSCQFVDKTMAVQRLEWLMTV